MNHSRYEVITATDREFGTQLSNGSWSGMIGMVLNGVHFNLKFKILL